MKTIGKFIISIIAIAIMFVPVVAVQQIEARAITHALTVEGMYVNGTGIATSPMTNATQEIIETIYPNHDINSSATFDTAEVFNGGGTNKDIYYRDTTTYMGNDTYAVSLDYSDFPTYSSTNTWIFVPLNINITELIEVDFVRIGCTYSVAPELFVMGHDGITGKFSGYDFMPNYEVSVDNYIFVNTISSRSWLSNLNDDYPINQLFVAWKINNLSPPTDTDFTLKLQTEYYEPGDILTWTDETVYIMGILLCDVLLVGAIVFASDPIDIVIDRKRR